MIIVNKSMLAEASMGLEQAQAAFNFRIGATNRATRKRNETPEGCETPLGHTYSLILEALAIEGLSSSPDVKGFIDFVACNHSIGIEDVTLETLTYAPFLLEPALYYARNMGLSEAAQRRIATEIVGPMRAIYYDYCFRRKK